MILKKIFSFATLTLLVALTLSGIAAWYSIQGLTAIFAAAVIPIIIMGGSLEIAKVITTIWLHKYWTRASWQLKLYLVPAVIALAFLTSMGIFGFLSKAHIEQTSPIGDVSAQVQIIDEKIKNERDKIELARRLLQQMDDVVAGIQSQPDTEIKNRDGTTSIRSSSERALTVRRSQARDRASITEEIEQSQKNIVQFQEEKAPLSSQIRQVEAEVGPIKYIAALIYGDNPDAALLERAVRWVIIVIVFVFDPLALTLVLASQSSYRWLDEDTSNKKDDIKKNEGNEIKIDPFSMPITTDEKKHTDKEEENNTTKLTPAEQVEETIKTSIEEENTIQNNESLEDLSTVIEWKDVPIVKKEIISNEDIETDNVTYIKNEGGYIQFNDKSVHKDALKEMHPELFLNNEGVNTNFGTVFPKFATKGEIFVRIDTLPNKVFKFDGKKWIETNKEHSDTYLHNKDYLEYLISVIDKGEYDIELLTDNEKVEIENYLSQNR